jgi:hypothetical protein
LLLHQGFDTGTYKSPQHRKCRIMDSASPSFDSGLTLTESFPLPDLPERSYADDEVVERPLPTIEQLSKAALATHRVCVANSLAHAFFGGFQCQMLGRARGTKDVDVEIAKPLLGGFAKVFDAFVRDSEFRVIQGTRQDAVCYAFLATFLWSRLNVVLIQPCSFE